MIPKKWHGPIYSHVLLVDDSEIDLFVHRKVIELSRVAEQTTSIASPVKALEYIRHLENQQKPAPDLIFLDINMPCMSGFEFLNKLQALPCMHDHPRVVMLSSSQDERDIAQARKYWAVLRFLHKPLSIAALESLAALQTSPRYMAQAG